MSSLKGQYHDKIKNIGFLKPRVFIGLTTEPWTLNLGH